MDDCSYAWCVGIIGIISISGPMTWGVLLRYYRWNVRWAVQLADFPDC
jgi:hypothetical protein